MCKNILLLICFVSLVRSEEGKELVTFEKWLEDISDINFKPYNRVQENSSCPELGNTSHRLSIELTKDCQSVHATGNYSLQVRTKCNSQLGVHQAFFCALTK